MLAWGIFPSTPRGGWEVATTVAGFDFPALCSKGPLFLPVCSRPHPSPSLRGVCQEISGIIWFSLSQPDLSHKPTLTLLVLLSYGRKQTNQPFLHLLPPKSPARFSPSFCNKTLNELFVSAPVPLLTLELPLICLSPSSTTPKVLLSQWPMSSTCLSHVVIPQPSRYMTSLQHFKQSNSPWNTFFTWLQDFLISYLSGHRLLSSSSPAFSHVQAQGSVT